MAGLPPDEDSNAHGSDHAGTKRNEDKEEPNIGIGVNVKIEKNESNPDDPPSQDGANNTGTYPYPESITGSDVHKPAGNSTYSGGQNGRSHRKHNGRVH